MSPQDLEQTLRELPRVGTLVKDRPYRQVWRFEHDGRPVYLKFYPFGGLRDWLRRRFRGSPAMREFVRLQWLQKAAVPSPRAVAALMGFSIKGRKGDALLIEGIEPSIQLDRYLNDHELRGEDVPDHLAITRQMIELLKTLARAGLGHRDLHLGNFLLHEERLYLLDAYGMRRGGLRLKDVLLLGLSARRFATRTDLLRAWRALGLGARPPRANPRAQRFWRHRLSRIFENDRYFGRIEADGWTGHFFRQTKYPFRWSAVSRLRITEKDWREAMPLLLKQIESDQFETLKRTASGEILAGQVILGGRPLAIVVKRPFRKYWYRYITEIGRGSRPRRAWTKAWKLILRGIPTAWPILLLERRSLGYVTDAMVVFERIPGQTLAWPQWAGRGRVQYHELLRRAGRLLRKLEHARLYLYDAKAQNWMIWEDPKLGPTPMLVDVDGVRGFPQPSAGLPRLLRSLRENARAPFSREDAAALIHGYAPHASRREIERLIGSEPAMDAVAKEQPR